MKKSELKSLIFETLCEYYQKKYREHLLKEGWNDDEDYDDETHKPEPHYSEQHLNDIEQAIISSVDKPDNKAITVKAADGTKYVILGRTIREGMYKDYIKVYVQWQGQDSGAVTGIVHPDRYKTDSGAISYIMHKIMRKTGILKEDTEKEHNLVYGKNTVEEGAELPNSTDQILAKFPTLKHALIRLQTENFKEFTDSIDWVSPKPTEFRINLTNGQSFTLKWMGKDFEATISGKKYYLGQLPDFQQALAKLSILYKEGPIAGEETQGSADNIPDMDKSSSGSSGGNFPGIEEPSGENETEPEANEEPESNDMGDVKVDFEADQDI